MSTATENISPAEQERREKAAKNLNRPEKQAKGTITRLQNLLEGMDPDSPEYDKFKAEIAGLLGLNRSDDTVTVESDDKALEILRVHKEEERDYDAMMASLGDQIVENIRLHNGAPSNEIRNYHARRVDSLKELQQIVEAAKEIKPQTRVFGCRFAPRLRISGRDTIIGDIQFRRHIYKTSDPLDIARLLHYIENDGRPQIEPRRPGDIALVNDESGKFGQWVPADEAEDVIRSMGGTLRRPFR